MKQFLILFLLFIGAATVFSTEKIPHNNNKKVPVRQGTKAEERRKVVDTKKNIDPKKKHTLKNIATMNNLTPKKMKKMKKKSNNNK